MTADLVYSSLDIALIDVDMHYSLADIIVV